MYETTFCAAAALLLAASLIVGCAARDFDANDDPRQLWIGQLQGGVMAIGGETTGWILQRRWGRNDLELDVSALLEEAQRLEGHRVEVHGRITHRQYVERGAVPVLVVDRILPASTD